MNTSLGVRSESIDCVRFIKEQRWCTSRTSLINQKIEQSVLIQIAKVMLKHIKNKVKASSSPTLTEIAPKKTPDQVGMWQ